jgi:carboxyl-terminal processing protease
MSPLRVRWLAALLCCSSVIIFPPQLAAQQDDLIQNALKEAQKAESRHDWETAREIYEAILGRKDAGVDIRQRYHHAVRRSWQVRRHQDSSYRNEVLSVDYGQALRLCKIVNRTLLDDSIDKKRLDPSKLFNKGLEEFDAALGDPTFVREHIPAEKRGEVAAFRAMLKKKWGGKSKLTREGAIEEIGEVGLAAEFALGLNPTTAVMEFACGACYAIDQYTVYLTPNQLQELAQSLSRSEAIGVGLALTIRDNRIVVADVAMGSPADQAGIAVGDQIISVNKKAAADRSLLAVKELLEGPAGSMVEVAWQTPGAPNVRVASMPRERTVVPSVIGFPYEMTPYYYLKINAFTETTINDVDEALAEMSKKGMKGLILDLRENNGGVFESAINTARKFMSTGIIASAVHQDPKYNQVYHAKNPKALTLPMVVLVDGDTASAAEVLAGALKDTDRAYVIGQTTFGKGCTQCVLRLPKAIGNVPTGGMRLTVARFFSPKGQPYSDRGVVPHFIIDDAMPISQSMLGGPYLTKAIEELDRMTAQK